MVPPIAVASAVEMDDGDMATMPSATAALKTKSSSSSSSSSAHSPTTTRRSSLTASERENRWLALEAVAVDAAAVWPQLPLEYQQSRDFIETALDKSPTLPAKSLFERAFPAELKMDPEIVLKFAQRPDFVSLVQERHLYVSPQWTNHKEIMLAYCQKVPRALQDCSEALCDDPQVVQAAITLDGMALQYASPRIRQEYVDSIVRQACLRNGRALQFVCTPHMPSELAQDRDFLLRVVSQPDCGSMYREIVQASSSCCDLQKDTELLSKAIENGLHFRFWPRPCQEDDDFLCEALTTLRASIYRELSKKQQQEYEIVWATLQSTTMSTDVLLALWERVPDMFLQNPDTEVAHRIAMLVADLGTDELLQTWASHQLPRFRQDRSVIHALVQRQGSLLERAAPELQRDWELVQAAFRGPRNIGGWSKGQMIVFLSILGEEYMWDHPELLALASEACCPTESVALWYHWVRNMYHIVENALNTCEQVAMAFIRIMGTGDPHNLGQLAQHELDGLMDLTLEVWGDESSIVLYFAQHYPNALSLLPTDSPLWKDWEFCKALASLDCALLAKGLRNDTSPQALEFQLRAVVHNPECLHHFSQRDLDAHIRQRLYFRRCFVYDFLRGMDIPHKRTVPPSKRCTLSYLDRADNGIKQLIAAYLELPAGEELQLLRQAAVHVCFPKELPAKTESVVQMKSQKKEMAASRISPGNRGSRPPHRGMRLEDLLRERRFHETGDL